MTDVNRSTMWVVSLVVIITVLVVWTISNGEDGSANLVPRINQEVSAGKAVVVDVRTSEERETDGYIQGAIHFDLVKLEAGELPDISRDTKIYAHCKGGVRAGKAETILEDNGFLDVENIGGLSDWESAGGEVVR